MRQSHPDPTDLQLPQIPQINTEGWGGRSICEICGLQFHRRQLWVGQSYTDPTDLQLPQIPQIDTEGGVAAQSVKFVGCSSIGGSCGWDSAPPIQQTYSSHRFHRSTQKMGWGDPLQLSL